MRNVVVTIGTALSLGMTAITGCTSAEGTPPTPGGGPSTALAAAQGGPQASPSRSTVRPVPISYGPLGNYFERVGNPRFEMEQLRHPSTGQVFTVPVCSMLLRARHAMFLSP